MAAKSRNEIPRFGGAERQRLIEEMHMRMLEMAQGPLVGPWAGGRASST